MKKMTKKIVLFSSIGFTIIAATASILLAMYSQAAFLSRHHLSGLSVTEIVEYLETSNTEADGFSASIDSRELIMKDQTRTLTLELPDDRFYLSIAPYMTLTHACTTHSLVSCSGEIIGEPFSVLLVNKDTSETIIEGTYTSTAKGFFGIWLPRDVTAEITVTKDGLTANTEISTFDSSKTCLTTLHLA